MTDKYGIVLLGHGSRDPQWGQALQAIALKIAQRDPNAQVRCAYLEMSSPDLSTAVLELVDAGVTAIRVLPMFIGMGHHARTDLPRLIEAASQQVKPVPLVLLPSLGEDPRFVEWAALLVLSRTSID